MQELWSNHLKNKGRQLYSGKNIFYFNDDVFMARLWLDILACEQRKASNEPWWNEIQLKQSSQCKIIHSFLILPNPGKRNGYQWNKEEISWRDRVEVSRIRASHPVKIDESEDEWRGRCASVSSDLGRTLHVQLVQLCLQRFQTKIVEL